MGDNIGIPSDSIDRIFDFIDSIWDGLETLVIALIEMLWNLFLAVVVDITPALGFSLVICLWLYLFQAKFLSTR